MTLSLILGRSIGSISGWLRGSKGARKDSTKSTMTKQKMSSNRGGASPKHKGRRDKRHKKSPQRQTMDRQSLEHCINHNKSDKESQEEQKWKKQENQGMWKLTG